MPIHLGKLGNKGEAISLSGESAREPRDVLIAAMSAKISRQSQQVNPGGKGDRIEWRWHGRVVRQEGCAPIDAAM